MISGHPWRNKLRALLKPRSADQEVTEELQLHIELQTRKYLAQGISESEAVRRAHLDFGGIPNAWEETRDADRWAIPDALFRNLRYAIRSLRLRPRFSIVAIAILAVGIGAELAVFNLLDALLLRPLPIRNADELVRISTVLREGDLGTLPTTFLDVLRTVPDYQSACGFTTSDLGVEIAGSVTPVGTLGFSGDCFSTLGIKTQLGRSLTPDDDHADAAPVAVITDAFWRTRFGHRPDALGQRIRMEGRTYTVVGVAEPGFTGLLVGFPQGLIIPTSQEFSERMPNGRTPTYWWVNILARRAPGISEQEASARLQVRARQLLAASVPPNYNAERRKQYLASQLAASSGRAGIDYFLRRRFGGSLYTAAGICGAILLIGCTNLLNLLLALSLKRRQEITLRFALGAKRSQVAGLFASESLLLVALGAGCGFLLAQAGDLWLINGGAHMFSNFDLNLTFNWRTALFLTSTIAVIAVLFAGTSAWQADRLRGSIALREKARSTAEVRTVARRLLLSFQITVTLALVTGSSLLAASLDRLYSIDLGVRTRNVWDVELSTRPGAKTYFVRGPYYREMLNQIHHLPGVLSATLADFAPFFTSPDPEPIAGVDTAQRQQPVNASILSASPEIFQTLGIKRIAGDGFDERDDGEPAAMLSGSLARQFAAHASEVIGHHIRVGTDAQYSRLRVVGVVSNAQMNLAHPEDLAPFAVYLNIWQNPDRQGYPVLLIKTAKSNLDVQALRNIVDAGHREYVDRVTSLADEKDGALMENKLLAYLSEVFSGLALAMAAVGLFGLLSYQVASRTGEIGVRIAWGTTATDSMDDPARSLRGSGSGNRRWPGLQFGRGAPDQGLTLWREPPLPPLPGIILHRASRHNLPRRLGPSAPCFLDESANGSQMRVTPETLSTCRNPATSHSIIPQSRFCMFGRLS